MTEEQKDILITRMIEHPEALSDDEITLIIEDDELRDIYSLTVDLKRALRPSAPIDANKEWELLRPRLTRQQRRPARSLMRIAAILVCALVTAAIATMLLHRGVEPQKQAPIARNTAAPATPSVVTLAETAPMPKPTPSPRARKSDHVTVSPPAPAPTPSPEPDIDEYLRLQQARIDNEIALQRAETVLCQYFALADAGGAIPQAVTTAQQSGDGSAIDSELVTLIIQ